MGGRSKRRRYQTLNGMQTCRPTHHSTFVIHCTCALQRPAFALSPLQHTNMCIHIKECALSCFFLVRTSTHTKLPYSTTSHGCFHLNFVFFCVDIVIMFAFGHCLSRITGYPAWASVDGVHGWIQCTTCSVKKARFTISLVDTTHRVKTCC